MFYEPAMNNHGLPYDPFKAIVAPRPIGWISTLNHDGSVNLAPYSFFNALSTKPHIIGFSSDGGKHSLKNAEERGEFVCNYVSFNLKDAMNATSAPLAYGESELDFANIVPAPSRHVKPPRVAASPAALECKWLKTVPLQGLDGKSPTHFLVLGEVVGIYIDDRFINNGRFDALAAAPIMRAGYHDYMQGDQLFELVRPKGG